MDVKTFISNYRQAFGDAAELPVVFWYSDACVGEAEKTKGCFFKALGAVRQGTPIGLNADTIGCGGGQFYAGFIDMPERIPNFVSLKERYKKSPEMVREFLAGLNWPKTTFRYLNFARIDRVDGFNGIEGLLFFATPDILSGLATWTFFDTNAPDAVSALFGSGCSAVVSQAVLENRSNGKRTFLGLFDPSVRPYVEANILSFVIPMSRFEEMYATLPESSLFDTHAWGKIRERINGE